MDVVLEACDEVCGKMMGRRGNGDIWQWNEEVKEAVLRKKASHKPMLWSSTEDNNRRYDSMKNETKKAVSKAMRLKAEEVLTE